MTHKEDNECANEMDSIGALLTELANKVDLALDDLRIALKTGIEGHVAQRAARQCEGAGAAVFELAQSRTISLRACARSLRKKVEVGGKGVG